MADLFFVLSKTLGMATRLESWALLFMALGLLELWRGRQRRAGGWFCLVFVGTLSFAIWPVGDMILQPLEAQYPRNPDTADLDGIIVLSGAEKVWEQGKWGIAKSDAAGERLIEAAGLAEKHPRARLIFTGGTASFSGSKTSTVPSETAREFWLSLGIAPERITLEQAARNTSENATLSLALIKPKPGETWALVTSAFHMPRAVQTFRRAGWAGLTPWPVDFRSGKLYPDRASWRLDRNLKLANIAIKEYVGILVYRVMGK